MRGSWTTLLAAAVLAVAPPATGSTLPPADLADEKSSCSLGTFNASFDHALGGRMAVGIMTGWYFPGTWASALRGSYRLFASPHLAVAGLLSGGVNSSNGDPFQLGTSRIVETRWWLQPAVSVSASLFPEPASMNVRLRGTLGPIVNLGWTVVGNTYPIAPPGLVDPVLWPNVEVAFQLVPGWEASVGFPDLLGVRATW